MKIIIYRHERPIISVKEKIWGNNFPTWLKKYNESGINLIAVKNKKSYHCIYTSSLKRSKETGIQLTKEIKEDKIFDEAEVSKIEFPRIKLEAKYWLVLSRILWCCGVGYFNETFSMAKRRAIKAANLLESEALINGTVVLIGHGFFNRLIKNELKKRWKISLNEGIGYLKSTEFIVEQNNRPVKGHKR